MPSMLRSVPLALVARITACVVIVGSLIGGAIAAQSPTAPLATRPTTTPAAASASAGVKSTGSVTGLSELNLGFNKGGQLTSVKVRVGDRVKAGEVLATIDPVPARVELASAQAQLRGAQAGFDKADDSELVDTAKNSLDQAKDVRDAVRRQADALETSDNAAVANTQAISQADQAAAAQAQAQRDAACGIDPASGSCSLAQSSYVQAQERASTSTAAFYTAQQRRRTDRATSRVQIENAEQSVVTARNSVDNYDSDQPHTKDQQAALVDQARSQVAAAQRDLSNTVLRAPASGTITILNGAVDEYVAASSGTSALAPGSDASIPGASGSTNSVSNSVSLNAASSQRPGGTQFIVLSDVDQLQVVAPFNEADAAQIQPDQDADVTVDAVPGVTLSGRVVSVAPSATAISGVINYYVTIALLDEDPKIRSGQTANVTVLTDGGDQQ